MADVESVESPVIRGSGVSVFKPRAIKHCVSHVLVLDTRFSDSKASDVILRAKCRNGFASPEGCQLECEEGCFLPASNQVFDLGCSGLFTADSDGEVIWSIDITLLKTKSTVAGIDDTYKYEVALEISSKPNHLGVQFFAAVQTDLSDPFSEKPDNQSYSVIEPGKKAPIDSKFAHEFRLEDNNQKCRLDLTYLVFAKDNSEVTSLSGPIHFQPKKIRKRELLPTYVTALLKNPLASDITLEVDGKKWHVHKCILAIRSPVFAALFCTDMKEKFADTITYEDVDKEAFDVMIKYIYTNSIGDMEEDTAISALFLSDRFDLPGLKEKCEANLTSRVTTKNCLNFLLNAEKCNANLLSTVAESTLLTNFRIISKTEEWAEFAKMDCERSLEIVRKM